MAFLLLYLADGKRFDLQALCSAIDSFGGIRADGTDEASAETFEYEFSGNWTIIRVGIDLDTICLDGTGMASFDAALKIQRTCLEPIHLVDEAYTFDVLLTTYSSVSALMNDLKRMGW